MRMLRCFPVRRNVIWMREEDSPEHAAFLLCRLPVQKASDTIMRQSVRIAVFISEQQRTVRVSRCPLDLFSTSLLP